MDIPTYPPPGELYDIGTHKMHLYSMGEGTPVVLLDSGNSGNSLAWFRVQPEVARFTRVITYDRSGLGWSERGPNPRSGETVIRELHALLTAAQIPGPVVYVGHSVGGVHARMFTEAYPDLVAGLVFVDSAHENQTGRIDQAYTENWLEFMKPYHELKHKSHQDVIRHFIGDATEISEMDRRFLDRLRPEHLGVILEETEGTRRLLHQGERPLPDLGDRPLIVLTATTPEPYPGMTQEQAGDMLRVLQDCQREMAALSTNSKQIFVPDTGHGIHIFQPKAVVDAIHEVVEMVRQRTG